MALLTLPLLAFGVIPQLKFLSEKAIQTMFNCAIKCMCIAFLATVVNDVLSSYIEKFTGSSAISNTWFEQFGNVLTFVVLVFMLWIMIRKMPQLVQGLLSGNPSLSGGDMMGTMKSAANTTAAVANGVGSAVGQVVGSYRAAKNEAGGSFESRGDAIRGTLSNLMIGPIGDAIPGMGGYRSGNSAVRQSLSRRAGNKEGYKPEKDDDRGPGPGGSPPPSGGDFQPKEKEKSTSDKVKSTAAGAVGSAVGEKAGAAAGTMAAGPAGGVVGGIAGSVAGDAVGSEVYDKASESDESNNSTSPEDESGGSELPDTPPAPPPPTQSSRRRASQEETPQESKKESGNGGSMSSTHSDDASRIRELQSENSGLKMDNAALRSENSGLRGGSNSNRHNSDN